MKHRDMKTPLTGHFACSSRPVPASHQTSNTVRPDFAAQDVRIARCYGLPPETVAAFRDLNPIGYRALLARVTRMEARVNIWPPAPPKKAEELVDRVFGSLRRPDVKLGLVTLLALYLGMSVIDGSLLP